MSAYTFDSDDFEVPQPDNRLTIANKFLHAIFRDMVLEGSPNLILRGSLLTRHYLRNGGVPMKNVRIFKDIDLLYYEEAELLSSDQARNFSVGEYEIERSSSYRFDDVVGQVADSVESTSSTDFLVELVNEVDTFPDNPNPSVKLIFSVQMRSSVHKPYLFTIDISSGDPFVSPPQKIACKTEMEKVFDVNSASIPMHIAWKFNSSCQDGEWRPKDFYDLYFLFQVVDTAEIYACLHLAFATKNETLVDFPKLIDSRDSKRFPQSEWDEFLKEEQVPHLDLNKVFEALSEKLSEIQLYSVSLS